MKSFARHMFAAGAALAIVLSAGSAAADVKAGVDAWAAGNFAAAVREWRPFAEQGDADAQFNLGQAYRQGKGVAQDLRIAQAWFQKAANGGHVQAQALLGVIMFQNGNRTGALPWLKKGAESGDPRSLYILGTAHFNGDFVPRNWPLAYGMMMRAADQGLPPAAASLEEMNKHIGPEDRQRGVAIAAQLKRTAGTTQLAAATSKPPRAAGQAPATARPSAAAPAPRPAAAAGGRWRVQLGAFGNAAGAQRAWAGLKSKVGALAALQPHTVAAGGVTRLQAGPLASRAAADRVCAAAKAAGAACFPVAP